MVMNIFQAFNQNQQSELNNQKLFSQGQAIQKDIETNARQGRAKNNISKMFEAGATPEQILNKVPQLVIDSGESEKFVSVTKQRAIAGQQESKSKQQKFSNLMATTKPIISSLLKNGDTEAVNKYIAALQDSNPEFEENFSQIPSGIEIENENKPNDPYVTQTVRDPETKKNVIVTKLASEWAELTASGQSPEKGFASTDVVSKVEIAKKVGAVKFDFKIKEAKFNKKIYDEKELDKVVRSKEYGNSREGLDSITTALEMVEEDPIIYRKFIDKKLGRGQAAKFDVALKNAEDVVTRIRTGAALNQNEQKFYDNLFNPGWTTDPDTAVWKMTFLKRIFTESIKRQLNPRGERINIQKLIPETAPQNLPGEDTLFGDGDSGGLSAEDKAELTELNALAAEGKI